MPNITQFNAPQGDIPQPTERAESTAREVGTVFNRLGREQGEAIGGAISRVGGQIGQQIDDHNTSQAIGHGAAVYSSLFSDLTNRWNDLAKNADANDNSVQQGFTEKVLEPSLQKFTQGFENQPARAQEWATRQADSARQHFFEKTSADMGTRAADAAHKNATTLEMNMSNAAFNDPSVLEHASDTIKSSIDAMVKSSPYMTADMAFKAKTELTDRLQKSVAVSTAMGIGSRDPDQLIKELGSGKFDQYLDHAEQNKLLEAANRFKEQKFVTDNREYELKKRAQVEAAEGAKNDYVSAIISGKGLSAKDVAFDPKLRPEDKENIVNFAAEHARQLREKVDNTPHPEMVRSLLNGMFDDAKNGVDFDPQEVRDTFTSGHLNPREEAELEARGNAMDKPFERQFSAQIQHVERAIVSSPYLAGKQPGELAGITNQIESDARTTLDAWRQQGKDVRPLLDPKSSEYLFSPAKVRSYISPAADLKVGADKVRAAVEFAGHKFPNQAALDKYQKALEAYQKTQTTEPANASP